jgi:hypothetical protein
VINGSQAGDRDQGTDDGSEGAPRRFVADSRQLPSLPPPNTAIQTPGANSPLDKTWGQCQ